MPGSQRRQLSLQSRTALVLGVIAIALPVGGGLWAARRARDAMAERVRQGQIATAEAVAAQSRQGIDLAVSFARAAATRPGLVQWVEEGNRRQQADVLRNIAKTPLFRTLALVDDRKRITAEVPHKLSRPGHRYATRGSRNLSDPIALSNDSIIVVREPIIGSGGRPAGAFIAEVSFDRAVRGVSALRFGRTGSVTLVDGSGRVLVTGEDARRGKTLAGSKLGDVIISRRTATLEYFGPFVDRRELGSFVPVPGRTWGVLVTQAVSEAFADANGLANAITLALLILVAIGIAATILVSVNFALYERRLRDEERSARELASIVTSSDDAIIGKTLDGTVTTWNPGAERLYGYTTEEMVGRPITKIVPGSRGDEVPAILELVGQGIPVHHYETERVCKDGRLVFVSLSVSPIRNPEGVVVGASAVARDVTEAKRSREAIETLGHEIEQVLRSAGDGIFRIDGDGRVTFANESALHTFGYDETDLVGKGSHALTHHTRANGAPYPVEECPIRLSFTDGEVRHRDDEVFWRADGTSFPVEYISAPIREGGSPVGAVVVFRDITERKAAEEALRESENRYHEAYEREREASDRLRELDRLKNEFVGIVAHDLRTPMAVISGFAELLRKNFDSFTPEEREQYLETIMANVESLSRLVDDVLDVARIESGELHLELAPFDLARLVRQTVDELRVAHPERRFDVDLAVGLPLALGDEQRQWQVLTNLLSNAIKFSQSPEPVELSMAGGDGFLNLAVRDHGHGIQPDDAPHVFDKFARFERGRKTPGSGLGLYICRSLVEAQGGRIWVESEPGKGATFRYTVPVAER